MCLAASILSFSCHAQENEIDTTSLIFLVKSIHEVRDQWAKNAPCQNCLIVLIDHEQAKPKEFRTPDYSIHFFRRVDINGNDITHWMYIEKWTTDGATTTIQFKLVSSSDSWLPEKDKVTFKRTIKLEKKTGAWKEVRGGLG